MDKNQINPGYPIMLLVLSILTMGDIFIFRPLIFRSLPKHFWIPISLVIGAGLGTGVFIILGKIWPNLHQKKTPVIAAFLLAGTAALLPGIYHTPVMPSSISLVQLSIQVDHARTSKNSILLHGFILEDKRGDWASSCNVDGNDKKIVGGGILLNKTDPVIECRLFPTGFPSNLQILLESPDDIQSLSFYLNHEKAQRPLIRLKSEEDASISLALPLTPGIFLGRMIEWGFWFFILIILQSLFFPAVRRNLWLKKPVELKFLQAGLLLGSYAR